MSRDYQKGLYKDYDLLLSKYEDNYFSWVVNFSLPSTNNLSEHYLRGIKSYIETYYRTGINVTKALIHLCKKTPYTIKEIFHLKYRWEVAFFLAEKYNYTLAQGYLGNLFVLLFFMTVNRNIISKKK